METYSVGKCVNFQRKWLCICCATYLSEGKMFRTDVAEKIDTHACCMIHCFARLTKKRHAVSNNILTVVQLCP
jgi:hypothetical protein